MAALALFVLSLPGIGQGIWPQSELEAAGLHLSAAVCSASLLLLAFSHKRLVTRLLLHPLVLLPLGIALISLFLSFFYKLPVRNFLGSPQTGEGVVWWLDWAALTASALLLCRLYWWKRILVASAFLSFAVCAAMTLIHYHYHIGRTPFFFPDFLALNLFALFAAASCFLKNREYWKWLAAYAVFFTMLYLTENMIAIAYGIIGVGFFAGLKVLPRISGVFKYSTAVTALAFLPLTAIAVLFGLMYFTGEHGFYGWEKISYLRNILSRSYLVDIAIRPLLDSPGAFVTGTGWGTYAEHVVSHIPVNWYDFTIEIGQQWEGIAWDQFHTHNLYIEAFYASGFLASILLYAYTIAIPVFAAPSLRWPAFIWAGAFASIASFWFLFPLNVAYIALASGMLTRPAKLKTRLHFLKKLIVPALAALCLLQGAAAYMSYTIATKFEGYSPPPLAAAQGPDACDLYYTDFRAGGIHLAQKLLHSTRFTIKPGEKPEEIDKQAQLEDLALLNNIYCQAGRYMQTHEEVSNRLLIARLITRGEILLGMQTPPDSDTIAFYTRDWQKELENMLRIAPARTDQAVSFLSWHLIHGKEDRVAEIARRIYLTNPHDPVGLWFTGIHMTAAPEKAQEGLARMRRALDNGIERFIPVDEEIKEQLRSAF